ncbi:hypothetical protein ACIQI8_27485 [Streptomyces sp. NPDC092369]|uniref:hypothetical protein n=1 Tax=Streptomyces sp. NPDC092369 TaxID=3366015 RepID=UPI0038095151
MARTASGCVMVALPRTVPFLCPICQLPVDLTITAQKHRVNADERLEVSLSFDTGPLVDHYKTEHPTNAVKNPELGELPTVAQTSGSVTVHVHRAPPDDAALARALARNAAKADSFQRGRL